MKMAMKQTEIGEIPADWKLVTLGDISERVKAKNDGGEYEILTISAKIGFVRQADKYSRYMAGKSVENYTLLKRGEFAYNKGNSLTYPFGCIYRLDDHEEALVPNVYISLKLHNGADSEFLKHLFLQGDFIGRLEKYITSGVRGNGLLNVNAEDFFSLKLALPPLSEQQKIAEILSTVDEQIANIDEQLAQTQELKKGLMQHLLTKGIGHTVFKDSLLGQVPSKWEVVLLDSVTKRGSGHTPSRSFPEYYGGGIKWVSLADSVKLDNRWIDDTKTNLSPLGIRNSSAVIHLEGTVLLSRDAGVGKSAVMRENMAVSQHFITWTCGERMHNWFLYYLLQLQKPIFERIAVGSTIKTIGLPFFKSYLVLLPPLSEQRQIAGILSTVDDKLSVLAEKKAYYQTLKKGLMQQLLTGQRRVRVMDPVTA